MFLKLFSFFIFIVTVSSTYAAETPDEFLWLEEVEGAKALEWVKEKNTATTEELAAYKDFNAIQEKQLKLLEASDKLIRPNLSPDGFTYNFWEDGTTKRGIWRRAEYQSYVSGSPKWETLLDIDKLNEKEKESWVYKGSIRIHPRFGNRALLYLSRGGKDAIVIREYDYRLKEFVKDGFELSEGNNSADWLDADTLLIQHTIGENQKTESGYPRRVYRWKRGQKLNEAKELLSVSEKSLGVGADIDRKDGIVQGILLQETPDFFTAKNYTLTVDDKLIPLAKPDSAFVRLIVKNKILLSLQHPWEIGGKKFEAGSLVAIDAKNAELPPQLIFAPNEQSALGEIFSTESAIYLIVQENVADKIYRYTPQPDGSFVSENLNFPENSTIVAWPKVEGSDAIFVKYENFTQPASIHEVSPKNEKVLIAAEPNRIDMSDILVTQNWVKSKDGTMIPYFLVRSKKSTGAVPTLLYGYGGFQVSEQPTYLGNTWIAHEWLSKGYAYVVANIRGGGEFGPRWHQGALREKRQNAYDDFISVAEDLIAKKITSTPQLGIRGGSNGGLLMGAVVTQRTDLFAASLIEVPLLDMLRYHLLLKGASWMAEYGDPDVPEDRAFISKYSPFQNIRKAVSPTTKTFTITSKRDDRVHPGHARRFAARMSAMGHEPLYYENPEGGHGAAADLKQKAFMSALRCSFLLKYIGQK